MSTKKEQQSPRKRVCILGAGSAGCACAWLLNKYPDVFDVELWEKNNVAGGVATSFQIDKNGLYINDGVQGAALSYRNTLLLHQANGFEPSSVHMKISFGKGKSAWNNYGKAHETELVQRLRNEITRFGKILRVISRFEFVFIFVPIDKLLRILRFSNEFRYYMVYPLTALFFGTGNQTPHVSSAIIARVFLDPDLRLFDYDPNYLLSQTPEMFAFDNLENIYESILEKSSQNVRIYYERYAVRVERRRNGVIVVTDNVGNQARFDEIVFACDAETALKILDSPTYMERKVLGNVKYFNDVTITHEDMDYMKKYYEIDFNRNDQYFIRLNENEPSHLDMSFNLTNYQPQLSKQKRQIFQTIFLDDKRSHLWNRDEIRKDKIILEKWWRQMAHTWQHFAFTVPFVRFIQGKAHTWFCGSYTLINTHEIAVISGLAVAVRLGAKYPFLHDTLATKQFAQYLKYSHGFKFRP